MDPKNHATAANEQEWELTDEELDRHDLRGRASGPGCAPLCITAMVSSKG